MNRKKSLSQLIRRVYRSKPSLKTTTMNLIRASLPIVCLLGSSEVLAANARITVNNNSAWLDSNTPSPNNKITARGAHILDNRFNPLAKPSSSPDYRKFYMYGGDDKSPAGTNCYSSSDLAHWTLDTASLPGAGSRPSVYLGKTSAGTQYILTGKGGQVYTSSTPCGFLISNLDTTAHNDRPIGYTDGPSGEGGNLRWLGDKDGSGIKHNELLRDSSVFQDDGDPTKTYLVARTRRYCLISGVWSPYSSSSPSCDSGSDGYGQYTMNIYKMSESGLQATTILYRERYMDGTSYEAPSLFTRVVNGVKTYYMTVSEARGWKPSRTWYKKGSSFQALANTDWKELVSDNAADLSYRTQHDFVMKISSKTTDTAGNPKRGEYLDIPIPANYIFVGDRLADKCGNDDQSCINSFAGKYLISNSSDPNYSVNTESLYHWMPVTFNEFNAPIMGGGVTNPDLNDWCINVDGDPSSANSFSANSADCLD